MNIPPTSGPPQYPQYPQQAYPQQPPPPYAPQASAIDPLKAPLRLVLIGAIMHAAVTGISTLLWILSRVAGINTGMLRGVGLGAIAIAADAVLAAASFQLAAKKRSGHTFATIAGIGYVGACVIGAVWIATMFVGSEFFRVLSFVDLSCDIASVGALAWSMRQLGRSRGRDVDVLAIFAISALAFTSAVSLTYVVGVFELPPFVDVLTRLADLARSALLAGAALMIMRHVPLADPTFVGDGGYRGPTGALVPGEGAPQGSIALGFLAGFLGGCIGLILVLAIAKGQKTKQGAGIGFACQTVVGIGLRAAAH